MAKIECFLLMILLSLQVSGIHAKNLTRYELLKHITNASIYDPDYLPGYNEGIQHKVTVQLSIVDLKEINEHNMEFSATIIARMKWKDDRLNFREVANFSRLELTGDRTRLVWIPDLFISNGRETDTLMFLKHQKLVYINPTGEVLFSIRMSMTNFCHMTLINYPFDVQHCEIRLESYAFTTDMMVLKWSEKAVQVQSLESPTFDISVERYSSDNLSNGNSPLIDGTFSYVSVILEFKRKSSAYGLMYFPFPMFFIIAMSSFAFQDDISNRITLCTTGLTTSVLQWIGINEQLPPVFYLTYLDGWSLAHVTLIGCILVYHSVWYMCLNKTHVEHTKCQNRFINAIKQNSIDVSVFLIFIVVYLMLLVLFVFWADISRNYVWLLLFDVIPGGALIALIVTKLRRETESDVDNESTCCTTIRKLMCQKCRASSSNDST